MHTFLPKINFHASLRLLRDEELHQQRLDGLKVLEYLKDEDDDPEDPCAESWRGFEYGLIVYTLAACSVWRLERRKTCSVWKEIKALEKGDPRKVYALPSWVGDIDVHRSHRAELIRRAPSFYRPLFPGNDEEMDISYGNL